MADIPWTLRQSSFFSKKPGKVCQTLASSAKMNSWEAHLPTWKWEMNAHFVALLIGKMMINSETLGNLDIIWTPNLRYLKHMDGFWLHLPLFSAPRCVWSKTTWPSQRHIDVLPVLWRWWDLHFWYSDPQSHVSAGHTSTNGTPKNLLLEPS